MRPETKLAITNQWNYCSFSLQQTIIKEFVDKHGRDGCKDAIWFEYLCEAFGIIDHGAQVAYKTYFETSVQTACTRYP